MILFAPPSPQVAAELVSQEILRRGHSFRREGCEAAYVRLVNYGEGRDSTMKALSSLCADHVPTIPGRLAVSLYDDKLAQAKCLGPWLPWTVIHTQRPALLSYAPGYPFVSKAAHGSGSKNVRLVENEEQAAAEIEAAFGTGVECANGVQRGYLIWQSFIPDNDGDIRVCVTGDYLFGLHRMNRPDVPFASGSGRATPILRHDNRTTAAFETAVEIADVLDSRWCCFDFVFEDDRPWCLEISFAWSEAAYADCVLFDRNLEPVALHGRDWPAVCVDELERLAA